MKVDYTVINGLVIWHLTDEDGYCLVAVVGRDAFLEQCDLLFNVNADLLPTSEA